jgi:tetratricopeptide (TPR) repeat protein
LDSTYTTTLEYWARLLFDQGKFEEAKEKLDKLRFLDPTLGNLLLIAIPVAQGDNALAARDISKTSLSTDELIGGFNTLADYQKNRKHYDLGIRLLRFALRLDSTSYSATFPLATLAEIYGLKGDKEKFYSSLEKSIRLGFKPDRDFNQIEPYKTFLSEERYKKLLAKYKIDYGSN